MTDRFSIISLRKLLKIILYQLDHHNNLFGIPESLFYKPNTNEPFRFRRFGKLLENPIGVAAGPQTQLSQNIVISWIAGARYIELKTIQTLDELDVSKPCIDMQDEGYNCEWSQELKIDESFDQYLNAWIIIHILKHKLGFTMDEPGFIFNMSIGYDFKGILNENVQWFLDKMQDASIELQQKIETIKDIYPAITEMRIDSCLSNNITLSTMHGCPPEEIEQIGSYLLENKNLHTAIKLNPTLLGKTPLRQILKQSGFETVVPDTAFEHDLKYDEATGIIKRLKALATRQDLQFSLKLTNTLESRNTKGIFPENESMMYMSGRALHPIAIKLANKLIKTFDNELDVSFSAGIDVFNIEKVIQSGLYPVTVCSDLLKPGGYGRLAQYIDKLRALFEANSIKSIDYFKKNGLSYLNAYAENCLHSTAYKKEYIRDRSIKTNRSLEAFDCVEAPCICTCPTNQDIPAYMRHTASGDFEKAFETVMETNPFPNATGMVCDHVCQNKCTRIDYDNALKIREVKRFIAEHGNDTKADNMIPVEKSAKKMAIIGAGPSGLSCAYFAKKAGFDIEIFEAKTKPGGMISHAIPTFRLREERLKLDIEGIENLGIAIQFEHLIDARRFKQIQKDFDFVYISTGAQRSKKLILEGLPLDGVLDPLDFLFDVKSGKAIDIGPDVVIVGGGNTAMDAARTAKRLVSAKGGKVRVLYRRTLKQMPAEHHEIEDALREGIELIELATPLSLVSKNNILSALICQRMELGTPDDSGRAKPIPIPGSDFEIKLNTLIPAIGQELEFDFMDSTLLKTRKKSYETVLKNVFIGGDAQHGAATLIRAIGDGRKAAEEIAQKAGLHSHETLTKSDSGLSLNQHMQGRMTRVPGIELKETSLDERNNFKLVTQTLTKREAIEEAARCLSCDELCNICVTVCPNLAFQHYVIDPNSYTIENVKVDSASIKISSADPINIRQNNQILHIADWCNECGNCNTFCPTKDAPYKNKPHIYLNKVAFDNDFDGYFRDGNSLLLKHDGALHQLEETGTEYSYSFGETVVKLDKKTLKVMDCKTTKKTNFEFDTSQAVEMHIILQAMRFIFGGDAPARIT